MSAGYPIGTGYGLSVYHSQPSKHQSQHTTHPSTTDQVKVLARLRCRASALLRDIFHDVFEYKEGGVGPNHSSVIEGEDPWAISTLYRGLPYNMI